MPPSPSKETTSYAPRRVPGTRATGSGWIIEDGYFSSDCSVTTRKRRSVYQSQRRRRVETRQGSRSLARSSTHERDFVALGFHLGFQSRLCGIGGGEFLRKTGEPGGNRTLNPQIKSRFCQAKTFEILTICDATFADHGKMRHPDGTSGPVMTDQF